VHVYTRTSLYYWIIRLQRLIDGYGALSISRAVVNAVETQVIFVGVIVRENERNPDIKLELKLESATVRRLTSVVGFKGSVTSFWVRTDVGTTALA